VSDALKIKTDDSYIINWKYINNLEVALENNENEEFINGLRKQYYDIIHQVGTEAKV